MLIGLQLPVLGYCANEETIIVGQHMIDSDCHHDCEHDPIPVEVPCEEEHEYVTVDAGDFQWSPLVSLVPPVALIPEEFSFTLSLVFERQDLLPRACPSSPPPPDIPIFRRDAALRL